MEKPESRKGELVKRPISYGLIGAGGFGRRHLDTLTNLERSGDVPSDGGMRSGDSSTR